MTNYTVNSWATGDIVAKTKMDRLEAAVASHTHAAADIVSGMVAAARLGSGTPTGTKFLRDDQTWQVPPTGAGGSGVTQKNLEDAARGVWANAPSTESGLTALSVDAATDDAPRIQAMLNYLSVTYGRGARLFVPAGTSNVNSGIILPTGVRIVGVAGASRWDYWYAGTGTFTAITISDDDNVPVIGMKLTGQQWEANKSTANVTASTGLNISGHDLTFEDLDIGGFHWGIDVTASNTYILTFDRCIVQGCMVGLNADLNAAYFTSAAVGNSGERIVFSRGVIANCGTAFWASADGLGLFFEATSIDYCNIFGRMNNAHVKFTTCHLESTYSTDVSTLGADGTPARYLFDLDANPRVTFDNCLLIMGATGIYTVINPGKGPWNYGSGNAEFKGCNGATGVHPSAPAGTIQGGFSATRISFNAGETTKTVASLFVSKWNSIKALCVSNDGSAQRNLVAMITAVDMALGYATVTLSAAAPAGGAWVEVIF